MAGPGARIVPPSPVGSACFPVDSASAGQGGTTVCKCSVQGCERPATAELKLEGRAYPLCSFHAETLEDRVFSLAQDEKELHLGKDDLQAV